MLLCCEPPMKGREPTGVSLTAAIHQPAETTIDASAINRSPRRRQSRRCRDQVRETERRHDEQHLQLLGEEPEADQRARRHDPSPPAVVDRSQRRVCGECHEEHEQRVRVVEPEHQCSDGRRCHHGTRDETPAAARSCAARRRNTPDSRDAHQRLGHEDAPRAETEHTHRQAHDPQRRGRFVDRDRARRVERSEEPGLPALRTGLRGSRVEGVRPS